MRTLVFDIETASADLFYRLPTREFVRLVGLSWAGSGQVDLTTDLDLVRDAIRSADRVTGHNIHSFDLPAIFGVDSTEPVTLADQGRVFDTWTHCALVDPAPERYVDRFGKNRLANSPAKAKSWFSLDEVAHRLGVVGKTHDLDALAFEFGDPKLKNKRERTNDGYGRIPVTDPRYRDYLVGDVKASEAVMNALLGMFGEPDAYAWREQRIEARKQRIALNGFRVDAAAAQARIRHLKWRREMVLDELIGLYAFPTEGAKPWMRKEGKEAILAALADYGITPETHEWPMTPGGQPSMSAEVLKELTDGTEAEEIGRGLAELQGQRALAQLALDSMEPDGKAHPTITMLQRSGRWSTTNPGLTVWSERDKRQRVEKAVFVPDNDEEVLLELDYSAADARIVAALSGDTAYAAQFDDERALIEQLTGDPTYADRVWYDSGVGGGAHAITALRAFGPAACEADPGTSRTAAKAMGHAWNYGAGPRGLANNPPIRKQLLRAKLDPEPTAERFCRGLARSYPRLIKWQGRVRQFAQRRGHVVNYWGRRMPVQRDRVFTQAPAHLGQSGTREVVCDAILRFPMDILVRVKAQIHDAIVVSVPKDQWETYRDEIASLMTTTLDIPGGLRMDFPVSCGPPAKDWAEAAH